MFIITIDRFTSTYHKAAIIPSGQTDFQFKSCNRKFSSASYEWLVVVGACAVQAVEHNQWRRRLRVYVDGRRRRAIGGGGVDEFRIKIWDKAGGSSTGDYQMDAANDAAPATTLVGRSIVIHD